MYKYTRYILAFFGLVICSLVFYASNKGWGIQAFNNKLIMDEAQKNCPEFERDQYGNCPPNNHRSRLRSRFFSGGDGTGGK